MFIFIISILLIIIGKAIMYTQDNCKIEYFNYYLAMFGLIIHMIGIILLIGLLLWLMTI